jgi:hypothetical protein
MKMITLKNGAEEVESLVLIAMISLQMLIEQNPEVFNEFVHLCRDRNYELSGDATEILEKLYLVQNGVVNDSLRNVILSTVDSDGSDAWPISPIAA